MTERRHLDVHHVDAVEEVFPKRILLHALLQVGVGRAQDAHVSGEVFHTAQPPELSALQKGQQLRLERHAHRVDFVEEKGPPIGHLDQPFLRIAGIGEGPLLVPKQLRLQEIVGEGGAVDVGELMLGARRVVVKRLRGQVFPRSRLPREQHRRVGGRAKGLDGIANPHDGVTLSQNTLDGVLLLLLGLDLLQLLLGPIEVDRLLQERPHLFQIDRLLEIVERPLLHGLHCRLHRGVGRHDNNGNVQPPLLEGLHQLHAVHLRHHHVRDHHVGRSGAVVERLQHRQRVQVRLDLIAIPLQHVGEEIANLRLVVNYVDALIHTGKGMRVGDARLESSQQPKRPSDEQPNVTGGCRKRRQCHYNTS